MDQNALIFFLPSSISSLPLLCLSMSWPPPVFCRARASTTRPPPSPALRVCDRRSSGGHLAAVVLLGRTPHIRARRSGPTAKRRRASMAGEAACGRARTRGLGHPLSSACWSSTPTAERPPGHRRSRTVAARPGPAGRPPRSPQSGCPRQRLQGAVARAAVGADAAAVHVALRRHWRRRHVLARR